MDVKTLDALPADLVESAVDAGFIAATDVLYAQAIASGKYLVRPRVHLKTFRIIGDHEIGPALRMAGAEAIASMYCIGDVPIVRRTLRARLRAAWRALRG
jgi:hypothetical protein